MEEMLYEPFKRVSMALKFGFQDRDLSMEVRGTGGIFFSDDRQESPLS